MAKVSFTPRQLREYDAAADKLARTMAVRPNPQARFAGEHNPASASPQLEADIPTVERKAFVHRDVMDEIKKILGEETVKRLLASNPAMTQKSLGDLAATMSSDRNEELGGIPGRRAIADEYEALAEEEALEKEGKAPRPEWGLHETASTPGGSSVRSYLRRAKASEGSAEKVREFIKNHPDIVSEHISDALDTRGKNPYESLKRSGKIGKANPIGSMAEPDTSEALEDYIQSAEAVPTPEEALTALDKERYSGKGIGEFSQGIVTQKHFEPDEERIKVGELYRPFQRRVKKGKSYEIAVSPTSGLEAARAKDPERSGDYKKGMKAKFRLHQGSTDRKPPRGGLRSNEAEKSLLAKAVANAERKNRLIKYGPKLGYTGMKGSSPKESPDFTARLAEYKAAPGAVPSEKIKSLVPEVEKRKVGGISEGKYGGKFSQEKRAAGREKLTTEQQEGMGRYLGNEMTLEGGEYRHHGKMKKRGG